MSRASPPSAQGQSPADALQDLCAPDPYLLSTSDPEEIIFQASAIRLTPSRGSPGHSAGPGSSPHEDSRTDSTVQRGYLDPRANDYTDLSTCASPLSDTSVFVEPKDIELANGSRVWQNESLSYPPEEAHGLAAPTWSSPIAPNVFQWTASEHHSNPSTSAGFVSHEGSSAAPQSLPTPHQSGLGVLNTDTDSGKSQPSTLVNQEGNTELMPGPNRGRSPVFKITTFSRGDSPEERSVSPRRRSQSYAHLSANPNEVSDENEDDHHSVSSVPVKRSENGGWVPNSSTHLAGIDPRSRGEEYVPSPNDVQAQRERNEKNEDISFWSRSVSAANSDAGGDSPSPPRVRPRHVSRRLRARSTGDHPLKQEDYFSLKSRATDQSFPGPGVLVHESSEDTSEDEASTGSYSDETPADVDEPGRYDRSTPEVYTSLSPTETAENIRLYPWHDPPHDPTPRTHAMQPDSSTDAMIAFNKRVRDLETASLAATIDNNSIINVSTSLENFSFDERPKKRTSLFKRQFLQASSMLKRQASDLSIGQSSQSNTYPGPPRHDIEDPPVKQSYSPRNVFSNRRHSRSPSLSNALLSMTSQMAAVGGSQPVRAVSPAPMPERSSLNIQFRGRGRSRSEIPRPSSPGLINLMTAHGGLPVPNITSSRVSSDTDQTPRSTPLGPDTGGAEDDNDGDTADAKGVVMDFPAVQSLPVPTFEGFRSQIMQLNPRLEPALIHRLAHEQDRRYKILVGSQQKHSIAAASRTCKSGSFCFAQGGQATLLQDPKVPTDPESGQIQFRVTNFSHGHEQQYALGEGAVAAAQFPPGVPLPPVSRLPARFECPICFEIKTFQKPSDWSKHVQEDVQPFTCTFPHCNEPKSFKRKADWVRHENEKHRHLEWWTCTLSECDHTCYRKDNFVQHLVREHKMPEPKIKKTSKVSSAAEGEAVPNSRRDQEVERLWQMVEECRHDTTQAPQEEPCRFCGNVCSEWRKLSVHLGKHLEQLALPVLRLAKPSSATHVTNTSQAEPARGSSSATYPSLVTYHEVPQSSSHLPQCTTPNTSTPNPALSINNVPLVNYTTISGGELSMEPESMTESLTPDQFSYTSAGQFGQNTLHPAQAQAYPLHQNSVTYPPPYNAVPRPRSSEADVMLQNSYPLVPFLPQSSLYPAEGTYPGY